MSEELALRLAEEIVATQGAAFIRELLRTFKHSGAKVLIGTRKSETLSHLNDAIRGGLIGYDDLLSWLNTVEGWGRQHVYLYTTTVALSTESFWKPPVPDRFEEHVRRSGLTMPNQHKQVLAFPETFRLGSITYDGEQLDIVWRKGTMECGGNTTWTRSV